MNFGGATSFMLDDMEYMKTIFCYAPSSGLSMDMRGGNSVDLGVIILRQSIGIIIQIPGMNIVLNMLRIGAGYKFNLFKRYNCRMAQF